jgi:hypothetical protein
MPITAAELILLGSLNRPEDDTSTVGGGIDIDHRPEFTQLAANDIVEMVSDNAGDTTQSVTITGRDAAGAWTTDSKTVNGTTVVDFAGTWERVLKIVMDSDAAGIVTVRRDAAGPTLSTIPVGERGFYAMFLKSASESGSTTRFEKMFWKNTDPSLTLNSAEVELTADPSAKIRMGLATAKDDSGTSTNRETAPGGVSFVDDSVAQSVPTGLLAAGEAIGTWIELALTADDSAYKSTFTTRLSGTTV